ncbi:hypothetical protein C8R45DRAFT_1116874, partial [Mycena sanguinolenta]
KSTLINGVSPIPASSGVPPLSFPLYIQLFSTSHQMSTLPETSLSLLLQSNSLSPSWTSTGILFAISIAATGLYYVSPSRLTHVLVSALANVERAYLASVENGFVPAADVTERLAILQLKVSTLRENSLRNSLSPLPLFLLSDTLNIRRSVTVLRCLAEISNESQLREIAPVVGCQCPLANHASISLRRRDSPRSL